MKSDDLRAGHPSSDARPFSFGQRLKNTVLSRILALLAFLSLLPALPASAGASEPPELDRAAAEAAALRYAGVPRADLRRLKADADEEAGIPVYSFEFETDWGDYDVAVDRRTGRIVDADIEIREEWVRRQKAVPNAEESVKREAARRVPGARPGDVRLRREGDRWEGVLRHDGFKAEFEADRRTGILFDWNLEKRD